jgi:hypothetical protein
MMRSSFPAYRRYSITHRAVQRLRELVPRISEDDDETLRDRLDAALVAAEDDGRAIPTLDAMLGEPQTLIPLDAFGEVLYAIIKEETVVTVLPDGHGQEILQRGQAMEQRVAAAGALPRSSERDEAERWDAYRRRWRTREVAQPVVVERIVRGAAPGGGVASRIESVGSMDPAENGATATTDETAAAAQSTAKIVPISESRAVDGPIADAMQAALERGRRRAAIAALSEVLSLGHRDASLLPLWNELASEGAPASMTLGDLIEAVRLATR